jgi:hypothetical protein
MIFDAPIESSDSSPVDADPRKIATTGELPSFATPQESNVLKDLDVVNTLGDLKCSCDRSGILSTEQCLLFEESLDVENQQPSSGGGKHCSQENESQANEGHAILEALHSSHIAQHMIMNMNSPLSQSSSWKGRSAFQPESNALSKRLQPHTESRTEWYAPLD